MKICARPPPLEKILVAPLEVGVDANPHCGLYPAACCGAVGGADVSGARRLVPFV